MDFQYAPSVGPAASSSWFWFSPLFSIHSWTPRSYAQPTSLLTLGLPLRSQQDDFSAFVKYFALILFPLEVLLGLIVSSFFLQEDKILESRGCVLDWISICFTVAVLSTLQVLPSCSNIRKRHVCHSECFMQGEKSALRLLLLYNHVKANFTHFITINCLAFVVILPGNDDTAI